MIINGKIKSPGNYELNDNQTISDLILKSGGFLDGVEKVKISVARINYDAVEPILYNFPLSESRNKFITQNELDNKDSDINKFILKPYDIINVSAVGEHHRPELLHRELLSHAIGRSRLISWKTRKNNTEVRQISFHILENAKIRKEKRKKIEKSSPATRRVSSPSLRVSSCQKL